MSGICGVVFHDGAKRLDPSALSPMLRALDMSRQGESLTISLGSVGMGAQRYPGRLAGLAETILHGRPLALAFHGSLYDLKALFPLAGYDADPFTGLLRLYTEEGMALLQRLRGEFTLALWDGLRETLYLATDRFRVHPLFYSQSHDRLIFASRLHGILACPFLTKRTVDAEAIVDLVASSIIPTPKTIFREVKKLPPGHVLTSHKGNMQLAPYWDLSFLQSAHMAEAELTRRLKMYFTDAVAVRLEKDGTSDRIGTFLSGGVDSTTVTGVLTQLAKHPIRSFSIGFSEQRFNEIDYARIAAQAFSAEHHEYFVTPKDVCDAIPILLEAFDEPFANASAIPTYFCAKAAREHGVEVLYAGDGGDELFAGNERYATQRLFEYYHLMPTWFREPFVKPLVFTLADAFNWEPLVKAKKYIRRASIPYPERLSSYGLFTVMPMADLLDNHLLEALGRDYDSSAVMSSYYFQAPARSELDRQLYIDLKLAISDNDLFKVTRMTEAAGVTVRFPFLDHPLAEFAATIPSNIKMRRRRLRSFFKKAYADLLPLETRRKQKHGFGLPIASWLRADAQLNEMMHDLVLSPTTLQRGYFRQSALQDLVTRHKHDTTSFYGTALWNLMMLELWHRFVLARY
jgi:asparagine synthase (glutamine-hydrolysing)